MAIKEELLITFGAEIIHLPQSEFLFKENTAPAYYFQIKEGKIKLTNIKPGDGEFIQNIHEKGESVGEVFLFCKHHRYPVNAVASDNCTIFKLERSKLLELLKSDFSTQLEFLNSCAKRTYYSYVFLNSLTLENATHQLLTILDQLKESENKTEKFSYKIPYTRKELSSLTGLRIETVIRILKRLQSEEVVKILKGRVFY